MENGVHYVDGVLVSPADIVDGPPFVTGTVKRVALSIQESFYVLLLFHGLHKRMLLVNSGLNK